MSLIELTQQNFDDVVAKSDIVLIDFWAQWCGPCLSFHKVIAEAAKAHTDVTFASVDIEAEKELADEFHIRSVPSVMILRDRVVVYADSGALTAAGLEELLERVKALDPEDIKKSVSESEQSGE